MALAQTELYRFDGYWYTISINGGQLTRGQGLRHAAPVQDQDLDGVPDFVLEGGGGRCGGDYAVFSGATGVRLSNWHCVPGSFPGVSEVGDIDGDGDVDLAHNSPIGCTVVDAMSGARVCDCPPPMPVSGYGRQFVGLGDINGDGYDDLAVAASVRDRIGIHLGPDGTLLQMLGGFLGGSGLANIGDIDGDGLDDLLVSDGAFNTVTAVSSADWQPIYEAYAPPNSAFNDYWGLALEETDDLDDDGVRDFVVGAPGNNGFSQLQRPGFIEFRSGIDGSPIRRVDAPVLRDPPYDPGFAPRDAGSFGFFIAGGGDVNGDGYGDVIVGSPFRYWQDFPQRGAETLISGRTGAILADLELWDRSDPLSGENGFFSAILDDLDGDGLCEFSVGSANDEQGGPNTGRVWIFRGFDADAIPRCEPPAHSGGTTARLALDGSLALSVGELWIRILGAPSQTTSVLFATPGVQTVPMGPFGLCVGGPGTLRLSGGLAADASGFVELGVELDAAPLATSWLAGTLWTLQGIFRDAGSSTGLGLTNALVVRWGP
ncbi:MAG: integrin alpha [Planctomycetota bacterium]